MAPRTCVTPDGRFVVGIHDPEFEVHNLREQDGIAALGRCRKGETVENHVNFPPSRVHAKTTDRVYEVANPFAFRGTTFINSAWADRHAGKPETVTMPASPACSLTSGVRQWLDSPEGKALPARDPLFVLDLLPRPLRLALGQASTDPEELSALARTACTLDFADGPDRPPTGVKFIRRPDGTCIPDIKDHDLYDVLGNNPFLPDTYKEIMVLRPGIQGSSEIIGEYTRNSHVFEYLRRNSYIPWGHFASNMANDTIRYRACDLTPDDMKGIRHLYYQRVYLRLAAQLDLPLPKERALLSDPELESLRVSVCDRLDQGGVTLPFNASLWGWNFGFGFAQSGHRLHASHQMIHQQNAMVPARLKDTAGSPFDCFSAGDMVTEFIEEYRIAHGKKFFPAYLEAIRSNTRTDGRDLGAASLVVCEDEHVLVFAPKAQVSEWELQIMTKAPCPHILAADANVRKSIDMAMLKAAQALEGLGAQMVTAVEFSGRFDGPCQDQHLVYAFIPRLPYAPPTFSEAQLRWISGCFPEDFAQACRRALAPLDR